PPGRPHRAARRPPGGPRAPPDVPPRQLSGDHLVRGRRSLSAGCPRRRRRRGHPGLPRPRPAAVGLRRADGGRRRGRARRGGRAAGPLTVARARRRATVDGVPVELTRREFDLLETLARNAGLVLSRERLLSLVWGYDFAVDTNVVDVFVSQLRRKLEAGGTPRLIATVRGIGFRLAAPGQR